MYSIKRIARQTMAIAATCLAFVPAVVSADVVIDNVTARQRYPWNGKVDIRFTVAGADVADRELVVQAVDHETGITNTAVNVTGDVACADGERHVVWDMAADGLDFVSTNVVFGVSFKKTPQYCVIDLSGGTSASSYPVSYLADVPSGGWTDEYKTTKLVLRKIKAGTFTMGSPVGEVGRFDNETQHQVTLTKDYWMGVFQVTQRQWELVMGTRPSYFSNSSYYQARPVEQVTYNMIRGSSAGANWPNSSEVDASSFLGVLRGKTKLDGLDLPTEAQWEYACRAGTTTALNNGKNLTSEYDDSAMDEVGRYGHNGGSSFSQSCDLSAGSAKVGSYKANAWGLYDMHGNVWEWCLDWYGSYSGDAADPKGATTGSNCVLRGGSWCSSARVCRSAGRNYVGPSNEDNCYGFRLCCSAVSPTYCVIDLSGGTSASSYPVSYLADVPSGGWTDEYKTSKLVLRKIKAGTFTMGGRSTDYPGASDDGLHQVTLTKDYWMGVFEVTQRQWELVMGTRPSYFSNDSYYQARPVEQISYNAIRGSSAGANWPNSSEVDATSFLGVLRGKTKLDGLDLPTEAQWEYACRAGTTTALNNGKNLTSTEKDSAMAEVGQYCSSSSAKVGSYKANAWGLYDMHGNVLEWCLDWRYGSYSRDATDPKGATTGDYRVLRGGCWINSASLCCSATRHSCNPPGGVNRFGFRLCCSAVSLEASSAVSPGTTEEDLGGLSEPTTIDLTPGTRTAKRMETLTYSSEWTEDVAGAVACVSVNGETLSSKQGIGVVAWTPQTNGVYVLTHQIEINGVLVGETLTATFEVGHFPQTPVILPATRTTFSGASLSVSMSCDSEGATIHYTTDGSTPTLESPVYKKFRVTGKTTVKAIAFYEDGTPSDMAVAEYARGTCEDPVITPADGTTFQHSNQEVSIRCGEEGTLRYTLDGTDPTMNSAAYAGPFTVSTSVVVKAKTFSDKFFDSQVVTANLTREWVTVETPVISAGETFTGSREVVTITCGTEGAAIRYTLDGTEPTADSPLYRGAFNVKESCTIKAIALLDDYLDSAVASTSVLRVRGVGDVLGVPDVAFTDGGALAWSEDAKTEGASGGIAMKSGKITHSLESTLAATVTGKGTFSFHVKTSCEDSDGMYDWDHLECMADGVVVPLDGERGWTNVVWRFTTEGPHTLTWTYVKDDAGSDGDDCAWLSDVSWTRTDVDPLPEIGTDATPAQIEDALWGAADGRLQAKILTGTEYARFRSWSDKAAGGDYAHHAAVKESLQAWLSYALDSDKLLAKAPEQGEMKVASFEKNEATGKFDFAVAIEGVNVGENATAENLATLFGVEGCPAVDGEYRADNVAFEFGTPVGGKVTISAQPADPTAAQFFLKVKMTP